MEAGCRDGQSQAGCQHVSTCTSSTAVRGRPRLLVADRQAAKVSERGLDTCTARFRYLDLRYIQYVGSEGHSPDTAAYLLLATPMPLCTAPLWRRG